jgi:flagellin
MTAVLNTNIASLWASKNLQSAQSSMANSVERLSSGLRINRARDDAAGLGVANALTQQINGANQGIKNLNDGISIVQTAEGAMAAASDIAQRILVLATQGANGSANSTIRTGIQNEMKQMLSAISSITARTTFSGTNLLDANPAAGGSKMTIFASNISSDTISFNNTSFQDIGATFSQINAAGTTTASLVLTAAPPVTLTTGSNIFILSGGAYSSVTVTSVSSSTITLSATASWLSTDLVVYEKGLLSADTTGTPNSLLESVYDVSLVSGTESTAQTAFGYVQQAASAYITALDTQRASLGALQNQLEFTISNVTELSSNLSASRSRVVDTDYATETASLTKGQILQQAATAMLAQANQMPNVILSLLK